MRRRTAVIGLFAAQLASVPLLNTAPLSALAPKLLREINLASSADAVRNLSFSPDEHWIAVLAGPKRNYLLLLPVDGTPGQGIHIDPGMPIFWGPDWSPDSRSILVGEAAGSKHGIAKLFDLQGKVLWQRNGPGVELWSRDPAGGALGFIDGEHLLARSIPGKGKPAAFDTLDLEGRVIDAWSPRKQWEFAAINPDRHLLAMFSDSDQSETIVIDYASKRVIQTKSNPTWLYRDGNRSQGIWEYFTESGKTLCLVGNAESRANGAECLDVDTGEEIAEFHRFPGGVPAAASVHGSRLVLTQVTAFRSKNGLLIYSYGQRVAWDFRSGAEIATWGITSQTVGQGSIVAPPAVAISSTGRYIAEGANGILRIYELP
jgi:WD40 repeat protein